ncbi:urotensin II-related peptide [Triplophysa rosa]|uniref:Urotensin II-related peptide n=1 Tax=Triplophysa rosa TaxID=992332 RepID=A0A9W7WZ11_TRIRA|nr:urotensin II-related peptide [Triplophysa rosa]KAI7810691.1 hypothetical protein IRJ41_005353 [Triplophysa rosa]
MNKVLTAVALLTLAPGFFAAPLVPGQPDASEDPTDGDNKKPPDPWKTVTDEEEMTARSTQILDKLLKTGSMMTFPDGDGKRDFHLEIMKATSSPHVRDTGVNNPLKTFPSRQQENPAASTAGDGSEDSPPQTEDDSLFRSSAVMNSNERDEDSTAAKGGRGTQGELVKMLSALEELMNSTLSHRITIMPRGNGNGRNPGKKNKLVMTEGNLKATTATTIVSGATSAKASTDHTDPKLNGKGFKKNLSSASKKPNKRVCFWKYCSQN